MPLYVVYIYDSSDNGGGEDLSFVTRRVSAPLSQEFQMIRQLCRGIAQCLALAALGLVPALAIAAPPSAEGVEGLGRLPDWRHVVLSLDRDLIIERKQGLLSKAVDKELWVVPHGETTLSDAARLRGKDYFLLRFHTRVPGALRSEPNTTTVSVMNGGCENQRVAALMVDMETLQVFPHVLDVRRSACTGKISRHWRSGTVAVDLSSQKITRYATEAQFQAAMASVHKAQMLTAQLEFERAKSQQQRELPAKRKIGARLCRQADGWQLVGFTEGVSPDNGKLQVRVSSQHRPGALNVQPGGFREQVIWDAPEN
jgi:hypothetical protein